MIRIRPAKDDDVSKLAKVYVSAFLEVDPTEEWSESTAAQLIRFFLRNQPDLAFVAEEQDEILGGICGLAKPWWDGNHLVETELFVCPHHQRKGIGSKLFAHLLGIASERYQASYMELITFKNLEFPLSWYFRLGFEEKESWRILFGQVEAVAAQLSGLRSEWL